ncbi:MAG: hypothetical protein R2726_01045 [Acidimicrobiales bacterium]
MAAAPVERAAGGLRRRTGRRPRPGSPAGALGDAGAGLLSSAAGLLVFLGFVLFTVQLLVDLHASSVVTDAAYSGARAVAGARVDHRDPDEVAAAQREAEARVRQLLGRQGATAQLDWSRSTPDEVALHVVVDNPRFTLPGLPAHLGVDRVDRVVTLRVEAPR